MPSFSPTGPSLVSPGKRSGSTSCPVEASPAAPRLTLRKNPGVQWIYAVLLLISITTAHSFEQEHTNLTNQQQQQQQYYCVSTRELIETDLPDIGTSKATAEQPLDVSGHQYSGCTTTATTIMTEAGTPQSHGTATLLLVVPTHIGCVLQADQQMARYRIDCQT